MSVHVLEIIEPVLYEIANYASSDDECRSEVIDVIKMLSKTCKTTKMIFDREFHGKGLAFGVLKHGLHDGQTTKTEKATARTFEYYTIGEKRYDVEYKINHIRGYGERRAVLTVRFAGVINEWIFESNNVDDLEWFVRNAIHVNWTHCSHKFTRAESAGIVEMYCHYGEYAEDDYESEYFSDDIEPDSDIARQFDLDCERILEMLRT